MQAIATYCPADCCVFDSSLFAKAFPSGFLSAAVTVRDFVEHSLGFLSRVARFGCPNQPISADRLAGMIQAFASAVDSCGLLALDAVAGVEGGKVDDLAIITGFRTDYQPVPTDFLALLTGSFSCACPTFLYLALSAASIVRVWRVTCFAAADKVVVTDRIANSSRTRAGALKA